MKEIEIRFPTLLLLIDFQIQTGTARFKIDTTHFTLKGNFSDAAIELAQNGFEGVIVYSGNSQSSTTYTKSIC